MIIYVDGSCPSNGRKDNSGGGFGVVCLSDNKTPIYFYSKRCKTPTTNNREEMKAIVFSLLRFGYENTTPTVYSDSAYCINTFNDWMYRWKKNNWLLTGSKKPTPPENLDLVKLYYNYINKGYKINLQKVKGHSGVEWNELADKLAKGNITMRQAYEFYQMEMPIEQDLIAKFKNE